MKLREILQIEPSQYSRGLLHAVEVADSLHRCSTMAPIPVRMNRSRTEDGAYFSLARPGRPDRIEISQFALQPALTLLHEIGHLLDHMVLNPLKQGFASEFDPNFEQLWRLWRSSRAVRNIGRALGRKSPKMQPSLRRFLRYQARESELWARTYVQWVVTRSNDLLLAEQMRFVRVIQTMRNEVHDYYWEDDDFVHIMEGVDGLFRQTGLI